MLYEQLTHKIIGCAMKVHSAIGNGFQEVIYQRALAIEFRYEGVEFTRGHEMQIYYRDEEIGTRRVDFFVEQNLMVEIKGHLSSRRSTSCTGHELFTGI
ncbi:MAG: GxxExxY protein [Chitinophagaceae bacterium]